MYIDIYRYTFYDTTSCAHGRELNVEKRRENTCRICVKTAAGFICFYFHRLPTLSTPTFFFFITTPSEEWKRSVLTIYNRTRYIITRSVDVLLYYVHAIARAEKRNANIRLYERLLYSDIATSRNDRVWQSSTDDARAFQNGLGVTLHSRRSVNEKHCRKDRAGVDRVA